MSDGLVQFLHRKVPPSLAEIEAEKIRKRPSHKYLQYTHFETSPEDIVVKEDKKFKESRHDHFLRKFEYSKALDQVLKPYVMKKHVSRLLLYMVNSQMFMIVFIEYLQPEYTYSVLRELERRNGLKTAIGGRSEKELVCRIALHVSFCLK